MRNYRITIIRHGQTEGNEKALYIGKTDLPLSQKGVDEVKALCDENEYPWVTKVYTSPLKRCVQTAALIFPDKEISVVDGLAEMDFGDFDGKSVDELAGLDEYKEWLKGGLDNKAHGGETIREMIGRTLAAFNEILTDMMDDGIYDAAIITHSGILMNMLSCFGLPRMEPMEFACGAGEGYAISVDLRLWQTGGVFEILGQVPCIKESEEDEETDSGRR